MYFREGAVVYSADEEKVGKIDRVVLDPQTKEVTHLVVHKGFLFTEHKLVPIDLIETAMEDRIFLRDPAESLDLPEFEEAQFVPLEEEAIQPEDPGDFTHPVYWYPPAGTAWWGYPAAPYLGEAHLPYPVETERNTPEGTVAMKEGAKVLSADDEHVGDVERVFMDEESDQATHFLISQGLFLKERKVVPTVWVRGLAEDEVQLAVDSTFIDQLPEYQED